MPRIDPTQLLNCLIPLLATNGGIKSSGEVVRLANLMEKYSKKLVSKCIYTQVLKCTEANLLDQFMKHGGWNLVSNWLSDGEKTCNWPFVEEILEMLLLCPVDGSRLKSYTTPKVVKNLSLKCPHPTVRILSTKLVEQWLKIAHQEKQQSDKQLTSPTNGLLNVKTENDSSHVLDENKVNENLQSEANGPVSEDDSLKKQSKENVKYKVSNKEGSGKLLLSLKRSTSPSIEERDSKVSRSSSLDSKDSKSKSSSSSDKEKEKDKDKDRQKKSSSSSSSHKSSSSSKSSHKDKERSSSSHHKSSSSSSSSKDKSKDSSRSSSSKSSSSKSSSRDKDKEKERRSKDSEKSQAEKDKETLNLLAPLSSNKLQRIPKRQHSDNSENKSSESNKDPADASPNKITKLEPVEKKKPSISIEVRKGEKPKTVKTLNSQFRNHGLAEEPPKPPSRKDLNAKKPSAVVAPLLLPTSLPSAASIAKASAVSPPPSKKVNLDKALETDNVPERVGGVKLIKPKPMLLESFGFMDALSASTVTKKDSKKRKRLTSNSKKDEPESPKIESKPLKFYKDTLEENEGEQNGEKSPTKELDTSGEEKKPKTEIKKEAGDSSPDQKSNGDEKERSPEIEEAEEKRPPGIGCGPDGPPCALVHPNVPRRKKRPIRWRSDEELTEVFEFELDETERTNVNKTFTEQKQMEHVAEKSAFMLRHKAQNEDTMVEQTSWRALIIVDFKEEPKVNYGCNSREAVIQAEREKNVLQELYFRHLINDSPHEPDPESYEHMEPQIIPLNDVTGNPDSVNIYTDINWPVPKGDLPSTFSSNAFGNVFNHINIPPAAGITPVAAFSSHVANPLANFPLGGMINPMLPRDVPNPLGNQWMISPTPFTQPPPMMMSQPMPGGFPNNRGGMNNSYRNNNNRQLNNGAGSWVRGNSRRGVCNQFRRTGNCHNNNCQYVHER